MNGVPGQREEKMPFKGCIWPRTYLASCGQIPVQGRLCAEHLKRVRTETGWDCAWPGCQQLSRAKKGLCSYHAKITAGMMEQYLR